MVSDVDGWDGRKGEMTRKCKCDEEGAEGREYVHIMWKWKWKW